MFHPALSWFLCRFPSPSTRHSHTLSCEMRVRCDASPTSRLREEALSSLSSARKIGWYREKIARMCTGWEFRSHSSDTILSTDWHSTYGTDEVVKFPPRRHDGQSTMKRVLAREFFRLRHIDVSFHHAYTKRSFARGVHHLRSARIS